MTYYDVGRALGSSEDPMRNAPIYSSNVVLISSNNPSTASGTIISAEAYITVQPSTYGTMQFRWKFAIFSKSGTTFTLISSSAWTTETVDPAYSVNYYHYHLQSNGMTLSINSDNYIGIIIEEITNVHAIFSNSGSFMDGVSLGYYSTGTTSPYSCSVIVNDINDQMSDLLAYGIMDTTPGGDLPTPGGYGYAIPETCQTYDPDISVPGWYNGYAYIRLDDIYTSPYRIKVDFNFPWLQELHDQTLTQNTWYKYRNPSNQNEVYAINFISLYVSGSTKRVLQLRECWYTESNSSERWVAMSGSDTVTTDPIGASRGKSAARPFKTITKAYTDLTNGGLIHVMYGCYGSETFQSNIDRTIHISPEDSSFLKNPSTVSVSDQALTTVNLGNLSGTSGIGSNDPSINMIASKPVTHDGIITEIKTLVTDARSLNAFILRPLGGNSYLIIHNYPFTYINTAPTASTTGAIAVEVQAGDLVGITMSEGGYVKYISATSVSMYWTNAIVHSLPGTTVSLSFISDNTVEPSIQYTLSYF